MRSCILIIVLSIYESISDFRNPWRRAENTRTSSIPQKRSVVLWATPSEISLPPPNHWCRPSPEQYPRPQSPHPQGAGYPPTTETPRGEKIRKNVFILKFWIFYWLEISLHLNTQLKTFLKSDQSVFNLRFPFQIWFVRRHWVKVGCTVCCSPNRFLTSDRRVNFGKPVTSVNKAFASQWLWRHNDSDVRATVTS